MELDPYYYCREHDGSGWSVRGPDGFCIKRADGLDKNDAYVIAKILSGKPQDALELLQALKPLAESIKRAAPAGITS